MAFLIRSDDGRLTICTASAEKAAEHSRRLLEAGIAHTVTDISGKAYDAAGLHAHAQRAVPTPGKPTK